MAWKIVLQPNGLLARFSDVVDDFTDYQLSREDAHRLCRQHGCTPEEADAKIARALNDEPPEGVKARKDKLARWHDCLNTIRSVHGKSRTREETWKTMTPPAPKPNKTA